MEQPEGIRPLVTDGAKARMSEGSLPSGFTETNKESMNTADFEKAIGALGVQGLDVTKFSYQVNGGVSAVYARMGETTFLKWDATGRGFRFDIDENMEGCVTDQHPEYLDYRRDADFDLRFD